MRAYKENPLLRSTKLREGRGERRVLVAILTTRATVWNRGKGVD